MSLEEFESTLIARPKPVPEAEPSPDPIGHYLVVSKEGELDRRVEVGPEPMTIGRDARQTLVLADTDVSRLHARVSLVDGALLVEDLGSTNGTFLDGKRITTPVTPADGSVVRVGNHLLKYERRSRRDVEKARELDRDLQRAGVYVLSLLPPPIKTGPILAEWRYVPSTQLGGDAFGYYWLDQDTFVFYLIDVSGHGVGAAMHSVTVLNVLKQRALPEVDFAEPSAVLGSLNARFEMASHSGMYFTIWYGVYRPASRTLTYSSAGHHQSFLVDAEKRAAEPLGAPAFMIGAIAGAQYETQRSQVPAGSSLYVFSDGVCEIAVPDGARWSLADFVPLLLEPALPATTESERLYQAVKRAAKPGPLEDDASLLVLTFE